MAEKDKDVKVAAEDKKQKNVAAPKKAKKKVSTWARFKRYVKSIISEGKKVHWPTAKQLRNNTVIVIIMVVIVGVFVWGIDTLMAMLTNFMISG